MTTEIFERYGWWAALNHGGLLIAPSKLADAFPETLPELDRGATERLRRALVRVEADGEDGTPVLLDLVLEEILGLERAHWRKGSSVDQSWSRPAVTGEVIRPARVWVGPHGVALPVFYPHASSGGLRAGAGLRLGVGKGRRIVSRVIEWLRKSNQKIALITTGRQFRLVHAGPDYDAFCEWDTALWFQEGAPGPQVVALRALLSTDAVVPVAEGEPSKLLAAIQASRLGQAELSQALGERVRQAVELLIGASSEALATIDAEAAATPASQRVEGASARVSRRDIYIAATRLVMRCVIILFAEARELLPRSNDIYESSYGLQSLRAQLDRFAGGRASERLRTSHAAWPRLLSLFSLVCNGSAHPALPIPRYAGGLFAPGDAASADPLLRALAAFESSLNAPTDAVVHRMLELLCRTKVKVRQGRLSRVVEAPVDFSDLSSEYIGILYEGLLDFELRRVANDDVVVFLNLGDQPALPFQRLNDMSNDELAELLSKVQKSKKKDEDVEQEEEEGEDQTAEEDKEGDPEEQDESPVTEAEENDTTPDVDDRSRTLRRHVQDWAERAVKAAKLVKYPRKDTDARVRDQFSRDVSARAGELVHRLVLPGEWFLVRWGGTRKGSGTFYTRPQIAGPTVRRTLQPLAFEQAAQVGNAMSRWAPRKPEEILALKVCDPAMGSGSFLVSALRYLTDALHESLHHHGRLEARPDGTICRLADGAAAAQLGHELLPVPPDHPEFEDRLRARLKRHVVERCVYGVDLDPLAVELARTSLWVETMDRELPFGFLDHKLKCGNSLVGCWFDRFQDYPILAWDREGGDKEHQPVHHYRESVVSRGKSKGQTKRTGDKWTAAIKDARDDVIRPELVSWLSQHTAVATGQVIADFAVEGQSADDLHREALAIFEELHAIVPISDAERRAELYAEKILGSPSLQRLRLALDAWCAVWFWPAEQLEHAPKPSTFLAPSEATVALVRLLAAEHRFFHWELEFPDVFRTTGAGFDAIVGNPPWNTVQPESLEYFSNWDPLYRTYTREQALHEQRALFELNPQAETNWLTYCANTKALSNWIDHVAAPFGTTGGDDTADTPSALGRGQAADRLGRFWHARRQLRHSYVGRARPFVLQEGGKVYTYRLFTEVAYTLMTEGGSLGILLPSGIYTDNGSRALRELFLDHCNWTHLYAFQNERFVFAGIHHSFKMAVVHLRKGATTGSLLTRFRLGPGDSPDAQEIEDDLLAEQRYLIVPGERIGRFSPKTRSVLELRSARDLALTERLYATGVLVGDKSSGGWRLEYRQGDFNMTSDAKLFPTRPKWEALGYKPDEYGHWLKGKWRKRNEAPSEHDVVRSVDGDEVIALEDVEDVALPLYQGIMVQQLDPFAKGWRSGTGLRAQWVEFDAGAKHALPHYLMSRDDWLRSEASRDWKLGYRRIARTTDTRTWIGTPLIDRPAGDSVFFLLTKAAQAAGTYPQALALAAIFNSLVYDWGLRNRLGGTNLSWFLLEETSIASASSVKLQDIAQLAARLAMTHVSFAPHWKPCERAWRSQWAVTTHERLRLRAIIDAAVAELHGVTPEEFAWIVADCDHPSDKLLDKSFTRTLDPKGFWRTGRTYTDIFAGNRKDKTKKAWRWTQPELRHPILSLVAFRELKKLGLEGFLAMNGGDGWMLPETLRLADYGLGHDARAKDHQPVAAALGPRFLPWQLEQSVEESWEDCRRHAELIGKILPPLVSAPPPVVAQPGALRTPAPRDGGLFGEPIERDLFGNPVEHRKRRKKR